jgi:hypothetical protein
VAVNLCGCEALFSWSVSMADAMPVGGAGTSGVKFTGAPLVTELLRVACLHECDAGTWKSLQTDFQVQLGLVIEADSEDPL